MDTKPVLTLTLYLAGQTQASLRAVSDMRLWCENQLQGRYRIDVVDVHEQPQVARDERLLVQILATPALLGVLPPVLRRTIIDHLILREQIFLGLNLQSEDEVLQATEDLV
jgi:circadian clock protein KaiB